MGWSSQYQYSLSFVEVRGEYVIQTKGVRGTLLMQPTLWFEDEEKWNKKKITGLRSPPLQARGPGCMGQETCS